MNKYDSPIYNRNNISILRKAGESVVKYINGSYDGIGEQPTGGYDILSYIYNPKIYLNNKSNISEELFIFKIDDATSKIQVDLFENMQVDSIIFNDKKIDFKREFGAVFLIFPTKSTISSANILFLYASLALACVDDSSCVFPRKLRILSINPI
jgi:hypothetical protein